MKVIFLYEGNTATSFDKNNSLNRMYRFTLVIKR